MPDQPAPNWSLLTRLVHEGERAQPPAGIPTATPIYTSATYIYDSAEALDNAFATGEGYVYARYGNPTVGALEQVLAAAEGGAGAVAFGSGMAALHAALLAAGTPRGSTNPNVRAVLAARDLYGATTNLLEAFFAAQEIPVAYCDMCDLAAVDAAIEATKPNVILVEQISNPLLKVVDVAALAQRAKAGGARLVVDSTMTTPIVQRPLALGADLVVHSATKYLSGHADATGGIVVARATLLRDTLRRYSKLLGAVLGPFEAQLINRGVKTLALRVRQQCTNAAAVAAWLSDQPGVARVFYPGLPSHPQHQLAGRVFDGLYGAMVAFELREANRDALFRFVDGLRLVLPATSLGDVYTLVSVPIMSSHRDLTPEQRAERGIGDGMVRLSIGIEDVGDIIEDLRGALEAAWSIP
ncbi:MAG TPA: PLP-dependent aspartate aminotransferase family protein [Roseiflexaceae bacterium]|nr:PLP-dependent aspartate aminotransferase family protein [Roseiflexaceae bacterium]